jgi:hypothetical protein
MREPPFQFHYQRGEYGCPEVGSDNNRILEFSRAEQLAYDQVRSPRDSRFDGRAVTCGFGELDVLIPAYANATSSTPA